MPRQVNNFGDMIYYLRKKARWNAGRAVVQLRGAELVRAPLGPDHSPGLATAPAATVASTVTPTAPTAPAAKPAAEAHKPVETKM
jgi:hypothetical protein